MAEFDPKTARPVAGIGAFDPSTATPYVEPEPSGVLRRVGDLGVKVAQGVAAGIPEAAIGVGNMLTGGKTGYVAQRVGLDTRKIREGIGQYLSPEQQGGERAIQQAEGFLPTLKAGVTNPMATLGYVGESLGPMVAGGVVGRTLAKAAPVGARVAGALGEGTMMAGAQAEQIRQQNADGLITGKQALLSAGTGVLGAGIGVLGARVGSALGVGDVDTMMVQGLTKGAQPALKAATQPGVLGLVGRMGKGALAEGLFEEVPQSLVEQGLQNIALDKPVTEGMGNAAAMGLLAGGVMGAGAGALSGGAAQPQAAPPVVPNAPTPPPPPVTGPAGQAPSAFVNPPSLTGANPANLLFGPQASMAEAPADPLREVLKPYLAMGINPADGPLSKVAAMAVDSGASPVVDPFAMAPAAPAPVPQIDPSALAARSTEELRGYLRNAQDPGIRRAVSDELAQRRQPELDARADPFAPSLFDTLSKEPPRGPQTLETQQTTPQGQPTAPNAGEALDGGLSRPGVPDVSNASDALDPVDERGNRTGRPDARAGLSAGDGLAPQPGPALATPDAELDARGDAGGPVGGRPAAGTGALSPAPATVQRADGTPFPNQLAAKRELNQRGLAQTHDITPAGTGFVLTPKTTAPSADVSKNTPEMNTLAPAGTDVTLTNEGNIEPTDQKARWLKTINDENRLTGETGVQLTVTEDGRLNFMGDPNATQAGRRLLKTVDEARKAGATNEDIVASIRAAQTPATAPAVPAAPALDPKRQKAIDRIAKGTAYFGTPEKATDFITANGIQDAYEAVTVKPGRVEVRAKATAPGAAPAAPAQPLYNVVAVNDKTGNTTVMNRTPLTHQEAITVRSKMSVVKGRRVQLQPVSAPAAPAAPAQAPGADTVQANGVQADIERLDAQWRELHAQQLKVPGIDSPERAALLRQMDDIDAQRTRLYQQLPEPQDQQDMQDGSEPPKYGEPGYEAPQNWRTSLYQARQYARDMGIPAEGGYSGQELPAVVKLIEAKQAPQNTKRQVAVDTTPQASTVQDKPRYAFAEGRVGEDWSRHRAPDFKPDPRQQVVMDAVAKALDAGKFYNREVTDFVAQELGVGADVRGINTINTEGGNFGYDVYHARQAVEAQRGNAASRKVAEEMGLKPGDKIGTIIPNDFKRITGLTIDSISESGLVATVTGKRGASTLSGEMGMDAIKKGIERAKEKGARKDGYAEFVASRALLPAPAAAAAPVPAPAPAAQSLAEPQWWTDLTGAKRKWTLDASGIKGTALTRWSRLKPEQQRALNEQWGPKGAAAPAATPEPKKSYAQMVQDAKDAIPGYLGKNTDGEMLYVDARGVRSLLRDGVRITESVGMRPTRDGMQLSVEHKGEFLTAEEAKAAQEQAGASEPKTQTPPQASNGAASASTPKQGDSATARLEHNGRWYEVPVRVNAVEKWSDTAMVVVIDVPARTNWRIGMSMRVPLGSLTIEANSQPSAAPPKLQPGEPGYTLAMAEQDLQDMQTNTGEFAGVENARVTERIKRQEKLIAQMRAEAASAQKPAEPGADTPTTVRVPADVSDALTAQLTKQKARITRLSNAASAEGLNLQDKAAAQLKVKAAEASLRQMRTTLFDAEDAAIQALASGNPADFAAHADLFPDAATVIAQKLGQNDELDAEMRSYEAKTEGQSKTPELIQEIRDLGVVADSQIEQAAEELRNGDDRLARVLLTDSKRRIRLGMAKPPAAKPTTSANTIFTEDAAAAARARLKAKLGRLNSGIDPEMLMDGITLAGYHIEKGARTFAAYARAMVDDLGEGVKPYLKSWYMGVKYDPRATAFEGMDSATTVETADVDAVTAQKEPITDPKERAELTRMLDELEAQKAEWQRRRTLAVNNANEWAVDDEIAKLGAPIAQLRAALGLEAAQENVDTENKEPNNDSAPSISTPALDSPMGSGLQPAGSTRPLRKAAPNRKRDRGSADAGARAGTRRGDDADLRGSGGRLEVAPDEAAGVGNRRGPAAVQPGADGVVAGGGQRLSAANYRPGPGGLTRQGSWLETAKRNLDLIDLAIAIDQAGRAATRDEQAQLAKYVGFGAGEIRNKLFPVPPSYAKSQDPNRLIWPNFVSEPGWKALAERMEALPREWQKSVLQSSQYAHYTSESIIRSVWSAIQRLGFTGGNVFEPGMGIGSFAMLMPEDIAATSKYTGVEFDGPTALIAHLLSPGHNMLHGDFIKKKFPKGFFDVNVGNPPFSQTKVLGDPLYEKFGFMLHDFFFAKGIDAVRPGGLQVFITSKGTMDKQNDKARKYLSERADLLGAIRLPSTAFEGNAGTSVVTDVIFLRKRMPGEAPAGQPWNNLATVETKDGPVLVNEYYAANPDMVLGEQRISGNVDDMGRRINSNGMGGAKYTVVSYDATPAELDAKFAKAIEALPENAYSVMGQSPESIRRETAKVDFDPSIQHDGAVYLAQDGTLMRVKEGAGRPLDTEVKLSPKDKAWFTDYVLLRDLVQLARQAQNTDGDWQGALKKLNKAYDQFRATYGPINDFRVQVRKSTDEDGNVVETETRVFKNRRLYREDYDQAILTSIEKINEAGEIVKAPFLLGRTIGKPVTREVKSIGDALAVSLDNTGIFDIDDVARRMKMSREEAVSALDNQVYQDLDGQWLLADEYLSGNVVDKLEEAEEAARLNPAFERNIEALKKVQPDKLGPSQISAKLGASWIPAEHVNEFAQEIGAGEVTFDSKTETWQVDGANLRTGRMAGAEYGTAKRSPSELLEAALNSRSVKITMTVDKKTVTDEAGTVAANEVLKKIKAKFKGWIWTSTERAAELVERYNKRFNNLAPRVFDGSHLTLPGVSLRFKLHPHQLRAILRQVQTGDTYLAHAVGAGKTIEMIAGGMEQKRLGLIKKPMYVVPNHMLEQFSNEFMELYPLANIMVADDENFSAERRKAFIAAATLNAPDAIIITHDAFQRIGVKEESVTPIRDEILSDLEIELSHTAKGNDARVRRSQLEQQIEAVGQRFDRIIASGGKDATIKFEDMGVDFVYVDEAHAFRKLDFHTGQQIKGIDPMGSKRALDMYVKTRILQKQRPGRAMVFATGTPVTNTMGELYTIMRFFAPKMLDEAGISSFDAWARQFAEVAPALEQNAAGKYELVERFAKFDNVPELMSRVRAFMDVLTSEHLGSLVKRPDLIGGKPNLNVVQGTPALKAYMEGELARRIEISKKWKPSPDQKGNPDPIVSIITDGRFAALDPRFFGQPLQPGQTSILTEMAAKVVAGYKAYADTVYLDKDGKPEKILGGTQIVFYNLGFGEAAKRNRGFDSRAAFTKSLTDGGIPRAEIAWFDDANTDAKKEAIFKDMRSGKLKVLIGSAKKMGTGVNVQVRLRALHYQDPPWYPSDVEQPHGRIIRQGNQNPEVAIEWYTTKGTYQSTMWQMVGRKQRFIDQAFMGDKNMRSMDDLGEASLFEQAAAVASGDPRALQLAGLKQDVERLERLQAAHASEQVNVLSSLRNAQWSIKNASSEIKSLQRAFKSIGERYFSFTSGNVGGATFTKPGEFGQAIKEAFNRTAANSVMSPTNGDAVTLGQMGQGIDITMEQMFDRQDKPTGEFALTVEFGGMRFPLMYAAGLGADVDAVGLSTRMRNAVNAVETELRRQRDILKANEADEIRLNKKLGAPFEHQQEMLEKHAELKALEEALRLEGLASAAKPADLQAPGLGEPAPDAPTNAATNASTNLGMTGAPEANTTDVVFSRSAQTTQGLTRKDAQYAVDLITARWANAPEVVVVANLQDAGVPEAVRRADAQQRSLGATGQPEGFFYQGKVYVVAGAVKTPADVLRVLFHEALGHYGLRGVFGPALGSILDQIAVVRRADVAAKAAEYGLDLNNPAERRRAAEEVLAVMAQTQPELGFVQRAIAAIRNWLRANVPGFAGMKLTDADIIQEFILPARRFVEGGARAAQPAATRAPQTPDAGLRFSLANSAPNDPRAVAQSMRQVLQDTFKAPGRLNWWHRTIGTQWNLAERVPTFKRVFNAAQNFLDDVSFYGSAAAHLAPRIIPKLETWKDLGKSPISGQDNQAIAAPIFEGTLSWARDATTGQPVKMTDLEAQAAALSTAQKAQRMLRAGKLTEPVLRMWQGLPQDQFDLAVNTRYQSEMLRAGVVWSEAELRDRFKLNEVQIVLYREFRAATDKSLTDLALSDIVQFVGGDIEAIREVVMGMDLNDGAELVRDQLLELARNDPDRNDHLIDMANHVMAKAKRAQDLMDRGYAPLGRFGRHTVYATGEDGEQLYFGMYENRWAAAQAERRLREQYPDATIDRGTMSQEAYKQFQGISPETLELFGEMLGLEADGNTPESKAFQTYLKLAKSNRSAMKRLIQRKGIAGFSEDTGRVLTTFIYSNARQVSSNLHMGEVLKGVRAIPKGMGDVQDAAQKLATYIMDPQEEAQAIRGLLFAQYLGGSIASAMINALQPAQVTFPYLSQFVGVRRSAALMTQAVKDALRGKTGDARLDAALKKAEEDGVVSPQEIHQLMAQARGNATLSTGDGSRAGEAMASASNLLSRLSTGWGKVFSVPEQFNRRTTFIAAYRAAVEKGMANPSAFAAKVVKDTQFVYNKGNKPTWARGAIGGTLFTFKQYSISYMELLSRMASAGEPGSSERREGQRAALLMLGVLFLMAGGGGMPGVEDAEDLIDGIAQRVFGLNWQTRQKREEWLTSLFGSGAARFVENGLSGLPWSPTDVSGRLGLGNLIPGTGLLVKKSSYGRDVAEIAGPVGDMARRFAEGAGHLLKGDVLKAAEVVSPVAVRNAVQGARMGATGQYDDARGRKVLDTTAGEAALKAVGFQPYAVNRVQDASRQAAQMITLNRLREGEIADAWARAIAQGDAAGVQDARSMLQDWNRANPDAPIRITLAQIRRRVQALQQDRATRLARTAPKEIRVRVGQELREGAR